MTTEPTELSRCSSCGGDAMIEERAQELFRARCLDRDCATAPWVIGKERAINSWAQPPAWAIEAALDLLEGIQGIAEEHTDGVEEPGSGAFRQIYYDAESALSNLQRSE